MEPVHKTNETSFRSILMKTYGIDSLKRDKKTRKKKKKKTSSGLGLEARTVFILRVKSYILLYFENAENKIPRIPCSLYTILL